MTVLAVDLAAKYSAACLMTDDYTVLHEVDSFGCSEDAFLREIVRLWRTWPPHIPDVLVIEDLPHKLPYSTLIKTVCRLQGRIYDRMPEDAKDDVLFLAPAEWRRTYEGMGRGTGPKIVVEVAARYGYVPPADLMARAKGNGGKTIADKVATDYCSAYLIARWAVSMKQQHGTYDLPGTSRYHTKVITKKDVDAEDS